MFWRMTKRVPKIMINKRQFSKLENKTGTCIGFLTITYAAGASVTGIGSGIWYGATLFKEAVDVDIFWTLRPLLYAAFIPYCLLQGFILGCVSGIFWPCVMPFYVNEIKKYKRGI